MRMRAIKQLYAPGFDVIMLAVIAPGVWANATAGHVWIAVAFAAFGGLYVGNLARALTRGLLASDKTT